MGFKTLRFEVQKFNLDYGNQIVVTYSGSNLTTKPLNNLVSDLNMNVEVFLKISDKQFTTQNPQYIQVKNYLEENFECIGAFCERNHLSLSAKESIFNFNEQMRNLEIIFNETPKKVYAELLCIATIDYSDPQRRYQKEHYVATNCLEGYWASEPFRVTTEQLSNYLQNDQIIGTIDFSKTDKFGLASFYFTRRMLVFLSRNRWYERYIEPSSVRQYRLYYH
ncbi:hypothetical protein COU75_02575 [Candidatus Peregrinibacteria bacterium CG10_big_fil_rev_8_21_14_0_10_42_8]|nr:MAG: hypothetical protein COU75_02575 [Candidatus Peregrinibacteria bacterium CG10_big_fil_rev_8_21_14_0_10_42_8]